MARLSHTRLSAYLFLLVNTFLWGIASPIIKYSLGFTSPTIFLLGRFVIAGILFTPAYLIFKKEHQHKTHPWLLLSLALLGTPLTLYPLFVGLNLTTSLESSILVASSPFFTVLGGYLFLHEIIKRNEWTGLTIAILGTVLLAIEPLLIGNQAPLSHFTGNFLIIFSNLIWSAFLLLSKKTKTNPTELTYFSFLVSIPFFFLVALFEKQPLIPAAPALPGIIYMAIFGSIIAFWAYQEGQKRIEASEAAVFSYLQPVFALPLALLWLKEPLTPLTLMATAIIAIGVYFSSRRET